MERRCEAVREEIHMMLDGFLNEDETDAVKQHTIQCPACMEYLNDMKKMSLGLQGWGEEEITTKETFVKEVMEKIGRKKVTPFYRNKQITAFVGMAAVVAIVVVSGGHTAGKLDALAVPMALNAPPAMAQDQPLQTEKEVPQASLQTNKAQGASEEEVPLKQEEKTQNVKERGAPVATGGDVQPYSIASEQPQKDEGELETSASAMLTGMPRSESSPNSSAPISVVVTFENHEGTEALKEVLRPYQQEDGRYQMKKETLEEIKTWLEGNGFAYAVTVQESDGSLILAVEA